MIKDTFHILDVSLDSTYAWLLILIIYNAWNELLNSKCHCGIERDEKVSFAIKEKRSAA